MYRRLEEIAEAFAELETAYNESPVGLAVVDTELRYRRINPRLAALNGLPAEAHIGKTVGEVVPALEALARSIAREIVETGQPKLNVEFSGETPREPGVQRYWREQWAPVKDASGKVIAITVSAEDITEQKRVAEELAASQLELQRRVQELETMMASAPAAILLAHDAQCTRITGNPEAHEMFRVPLDQPIYAGAFEAYEGENFPDGNAGRRLAPEELPMEAAARTGKPVRYGERTLRVSDGPQKHIVGSAHPLFNADGSVRGVIAAYNDITARKRAEQKLAQEMRNKDAFLATLSHEVRNPLNALAAGIGVLEMQGRDHPQMQRVVAMLARQHRQLTRLVDDLLDISRVSRGQMSLQLGTVDVEQCIREAMHATEPLVAAKRQLLVHDGPNAAVTVSGDAARITQIITNLLQNASKFSPEGAHVAIEAAHRGDKVVITVADDGPGIASDVLPHVFDRFFTTGTSDRGKQGLGIGLWLARELAQLQGGTITAANRQPGPGALFTVELPSAGGLAARVASVSGHDWGGSTARQFSDHAAFTVPETKQPYRDG
jgi:PAS domain S-box-containing protein